jgi:hypothetical protein
VYRSRRPGYDGCNGDHREIAASRNYPFGNFGVSGRRTRLYPGRSMIRTGCTTRRHATIIRVAALHPRRPKRGKAQLFTYAYSNPVSGRDPSGMDDYFAIAPEPPLGDQSVEADAGRAKCRTGHLGRLISCVITCFIQ